MRKKKLSNLRVGLFNFIAWIVLFIRTPPNPKMRFSVNLILRKPIQISLHALNSQLQWGIQDFPDGRQPQKGRQSIIWVMFPENCLPVKKITTRLIVDS